MTPDRRLDQLEPLMADSLQKTDRLIEGQGQIIEIATRADQNADTAARGVANLTISTQRQFDALRASQEEFRITQEKLIGNQEEFRLTQNEFKATQDKLMAGQELILQILREKLL